MAEVIKTAFNCCSAMFTKDTSKNLFWWEFLFIHCYYGCWFWNRGICKRPSALVKFRFYCFTLQIRGLNVWDLPFLGCLDFPLAASPVNLVSLGLPSLLAPRSGGPEIAYVAEEGLGLRFEQIFGRLTGKWIFRGGGSDFLFFQLDTWWLGIHHEKAQQWDSWTELDA